jgi:hypothetical protein
MVCDRPAPVLPAVFQGVRVDDLIDLGMNVPTKRQTTKQESAQVAMNILHIQ